MACKYFHCVNTITVGTSAVALSFTSSPAAADTNRFCFRIQDMIPAAGDALPVTISVNGAAVPLLDKYGNPVTGSGLKKGIPYKGYYGASTPHVIVHNIPMGCL